MFGRKTGVSCHILRSEKQKYHVTVLCRKKEKNHVSNENSCVTVVKIRVSILSGVLTLY